MESKKNAIKIEKSSIDKIETDKTKTLYFSDTILSGFRFIVRPSGKRSFDFRYRVNSIQKCIKIGDYGAITAFQAREAAKRYAAQVSLGKDPLQEKVSARLKAASDLTVSELVEKYLTEGKKYKTDKRQSSWDLDRSCYYRHLIPLLGNKKIKDLSANEISKWQFSVRDGKTSCDITTKKRGKAKVRGGVTAAGRAFQSLNAMFNWAIKLELIEKNPCCGIKKLEAPPRERYLSSDEAALFWKTLEKYESYSTGNFLQIMLLKLLCLTGARLSEVKNLKFSDIDYQRKILIVSTLRNKSGNKQKTKSIPLSDIAIKLFQKIPKNGIYVFRQQKADKPISSPQKLFSKIKNEIGASDICIHTLRHTMASQNLADNYDLSVASKVLGHSKISTTSRYAHLRPNVGHNAVNDAGKIYINNQNNNSI